MESRPTHSDEFQSSGMRQSRATSVPSVPVRRKRRFLIVGALLLVAISYACVAVLRYRVSHAARLREAGAVESILSLGGEIEDQLVEESVPLGRLLPGSGAARYRFAIRVRNPRVTDDDLAVLDQFDADRVASLDLVNCAVGDATLARAGRFQKLTLLGLGQGRNNKREPWPTGPTDLLTEAGFVHLARLPDLQTVGLHGPDVTDRALAHLAGAQKLRVLILYGSRVTGAGLASLGPKPELSTLKLGGTQIGDDDLPALERFPSLETLDLIETAVTDSGLPRLKVLTHLKRLSLSGCMVSDAAVDALIRARPGLLVDHAASSTVPRGPGR
jgi:hypothetical protein